MVKCFKLPEIQVCIGFGGFLPGSLRHQNWVVSRRKISIFTIAKIVKAARRNTQNVDIHNYPAAVDKSRKMAQMGRQVI